MYIRQMLTILISKYLIMISYEHKCILELGLYSARITKLWVREEHYMVNICCKSIPTVDICASYYKRCVVKGLNK